MKKTIALILAAIIAVSAFTLVATASAMSFRGWKNFSPGPMGPGLGWGWLRPGNFSGNSSTSIQTNSVSLDGTFAKWGDTNVTGGIHAKVRTVVNGTNIRQSSFATAIWDTNNFRPEAAARAKENFTFVFYTAALVEPQVTQLNTTGNDLFMSGMWNVTKVTSTFTVFTDINGKVTGFNRTKNVVALTTQAYGELKVTGNWVNLTLNITGIDQLSGQVHMQRIASRLCNPFKVGNDNSTTVTTTDIVAVAKAFGSTPGWNNYDQRMDYNFDCKIDICDLTTVAANINVQ